MTVQVAFVCVQNAGRSQMAHAFARRERDARGLSGRVELVTGGTRPAEAVHDEVVRATRAAGLNISDRTPREIGFEEIQASDYVVTMGCSAGDVCPARWAGESRDWDLADPAGASPAEVRRVRDEIERRVSALFDEIESGGEGRPT